MNLLLWWKVVRVWWKPALIIISVLSALFYFRSTILTNERIKQKLEQSEAYRETTENINEALEDLRGITVDDAREWLRKYSE